MIHTLDQDDSMEILLMKLKYITLLAFHLLQPLLLPSS